MRPDDIYFKPGDKVMRVYPGREHGIPATHGYPVMGSVYRVEDFYEGPDFNAVMLVGFGGFKYDAFGQPIGWRAKHFRKVEEIRLCVAAVKHTQSPVETTKTP